MSSINRGTDSEFCCRRIRTALVVTLVAIGCGRYPANTGDTGDLIGPADIHFNDDAATNAAPGDALLNLQFVDQQGKTVRPRDLLGAKNLVLVFTRGYNGSICPYCSRYTSGLITNYAAISQRGTEVLVVYPIAKPDQSQRLDEFLKATFSRSGEAVFRVSFVVQLHSATAAEIEFGRDNSLDDGPRYVAQLSKKGVGIGRRASDASRCVIESALLPLAHGPAEAYTLAVERQPDSWWVLLDEEPVGFVPVLPEPTASAFSLCAEEGEAWFSDVILQALGAPQSDAAAGGLTSTTAVFFS
jgi:AhpC/TSA family